jgi:NADH:ubiquinone oxidoreductase subunit 5 (subunit L)/multisubunit Na+/H+ antiporter MnhA subunit
MDIKEIAVIFLLILIFYLFYRLYRSKKQNQQQKTRTRNERINVSMLVVSVLALIAFVFDFHISLPFKSTPILNGKVTISGMATFRQTLTAETTGLTSTPIIPDLGTFSYKWKRNKINIGGANSKTYTLVVDDVGTNISVTVTTENTQDSVTSTETGIVTKATQDAPATPILASKTATSVTLTVIAGTEYCNSADSTWQDSPTFNGLTPNTSYTFYARLKETATHAASPSLCLGIIRTLLSKKEEDSITEKEFKEKAKELLEDALKKM